MEFVPVATPQTESELAVMVSVLQANGIPHFVLNRGFGGLYPGMKLHLINGQRIMVLQDHAAEARDLLSVFDQAPIDFETHVKLSLKDRLRVIAELMIGGWSVPVKRTRLDDQQQGTGQGLPMNQDQLDVEAYIKTSDVGAVVALLSNTLGTLEVDDSLVGDELRVFTSGQVRVVLEPGEEGFLSVWVRGSEAWPSSPALARHLASHFPCAVRCDPGDAFPGVSPYSSVFLHIECGRESLITLG